MKRYRPAEASEYLLRAHGLRRAPRTLANLRTKGDGPRYTKPSPIEVLYDEKDLDDYAERLTARKYYSTAEEAYPQN
jgi:hypothetical protein